MNCFLRILDHGGMLSVEEMRELHAAIRELQAELEYWKAIAEDRKHLLMIVLEARK